MFPGKKEKIIFLNHAGPCHKYFNALFTLQHRDRSHRIIYQLKYLLNYSVIFQYLVVLSNLEKRTRDIFVVVKLISHKLHIHNHLR